MQTDVAKAPKKKGQRLTYRVKGTAREIVPSFTPALFRSDAFVASRAKHLEKLRLLYSKTTASRPGSLLRRRRIGQSMIACTETLYRVSEFQRWISFGALIDYLREGVKLSIEKVDRAPKGRKVGRSGSIQTELKRHYRMRPAPLADRYSPATPDEAFAIAQDLGHLLGVDSSILLEAYNGQTTDLELRDSVLEQCHYKLALAYLA